MPSRLSLDILGEAVEVSSEDPEWISVVGELWRPFAQDLEVEPIATIAISSVGTGWTVDCSGRERVTAETAWRVLDEIRSSVITRAAARRDRYLDLHAGVAAKGGSATLFVGASNSGKTTLSLRLAQGGWAYLSDDLAPVHRGSKEVVPFPAPLRIRDVGRWSALQWGPSWLGSPGEAFQIPGPSAPTEAVSIGWIVVLERARTGLEPLSSAAAAALCGQYIGQLDPEDLRLLLELAGKASCFVLGAAGAEEAWASLQPPLGDTGGDWTNR